MAVVSELWGSARGCFRGRAVGLFDLLADGAGAVGVGGNHDVGAAEWLVRANTHHVGVFHAGHLLGSTCFGGASDDTVYNGAFPGEIAQWIHHVRNIFGGGRFASCRTAACGFFFLHDGD